MATDWVYESVHIPARAGEPERYYVIKREFVWSNGRKYSGAIHVLRCESGKTEITPDATVIGIWQDELEMQKHMTKYFMR